MKGKIEGGKIIIPIYWEVYKNKKIIIKTARIQKEFELILNKIRNYFNNKLPLTKTGEIR